MNAASAWGPMSVGATSGNVFFAGGFDVQRLSLADGSIVWTGGLDGEVVDIAVDSTAVYAAGSRSAKYDEWEVGKLDLATGKAIWDVGFDLTEGNDSADAIAVSSLGVFVAGFERHDAFSPTTMKWHVVWLDPSTGAVGWDLSVPSSGDDQPFAAAADPSDVVAGKARGALRIERRKASDGTM